MARATVVDALSEQTLNGAVSVGGGSATLSADPGSAMPSGAGVFSVLITEGTIADSEVVNVTRSGTTLTLTSTFSKSHGTGATIKYVAAAADFNNKGSLDATNTWALAQTFTTSAVFSSGFTVTSGQIGLPTGSVSAPAVYFGSGTNYGFYRTSNSMAMAIAGTNKLTASSTLFTIGATLRNTGGVATGHKIPGSYPYQILSTDSELILVDYSGSPTVYLPSLDTGTSILSGGRYTIKDYDGGASPATPITVTVITAEGVQIDGATLVLIDQPYGSITLQARIDGTLGNRWQTIQPVPNVRRTAGHVFSGSNNGTGTSGASETDLATYSMPANLVADTAENLAGSSMAFEAYGTYAANANGKRIKVKIDSTVIFDSGSLAINGKKWVLQGRIAQTSGGGGEIDGWAILNTGDATYPVVIDFAPGSASTFGLSMDMTIARTFKITGTGTSNNDIVLQHLICDVDIPRP